MDQKREQVSFVGLGPVGQRMALNLLQGMAGEMDCCVFDPLAERMEPLMAQGACCVEQLGKVAKSGSVVFTMVPDDRLLLQVTLGEGGILKQLGTGGIHVSLSTSSPRVSMQLEKLYKKQGNTYLAATVLGDAAMAEQRDLVLFLCGDLSAKTRVRPLLATMSNRVSDLGKPIERAAIVHAASMVLTAAVIESLGEMAALGEAYGIGRERFLRWLLASPLLRGEMVEHYGSRVGKRDFGHAQCLVEDGLKEVELAIQMGQEQALDLPCADVVYEHLLAALEAGRGNADWTVLSDFARPGASHGLFGLESEASDA